jgi:hypothetical protein
MTKKREKLDKDILTITTKIDKLTKPQRGKRWELNAQIREAIVNSGVTDWPRIAGKYQRTGTAPPKK